MNADEHSVESTMASTYRLVNAKRQLRNTISHRRLKRPLQLEVAVAADEPLIRRYMRFEQLPMNGLLRAGNEDLTTEDAAADMDKIVMARVDSQAIRNGLVTLINDGGCLVGMLCETIVDRAVVENAEETKFGAQPLPDDLSSLIDEARSRHSWRTTAAGLIEVQKRWLRAQLDCRLPIDAKKWLFLHSGSVLPSHQGGNLFKHMLVESIKKARERSIDYVVMFSSAISSRLLAERVGLTQIAAMEYARFFYHGRPLWPTGTSYDGGKLNTAYFGRVKKLKTDDQDTQS